MLKCSGSLTCDNITFDVWRKEMKTGIFAAVIAMLLGLAGCSTTNTRSVHDDSQAVYRASYGSVTRIEQAQARGETSGAGAVIGGIVGGVAGHQIGQGRGKDAATVAGVVGGALVGNQIEKSNSSPKAYYRVSVRLDNGDYRTFQQNAIGDLQVGDRIRVDNDRVVRY
jgi:outer membrane lipoprotein SlyB